MNNKGLLAIAASACLAMLSQAAVAAKGFSYTYVDGGYRGYAPIQSMRTVWPQTCHSARRITSWCWPVIHTSGRTRPKGSPVWMSRLTEFTIGGGGHYSITDRIDLVGSVVYVNEQSTGKAKYPGESSKSRIKGTREGYEIGVSGRIRAMDKLELTPLVVYRNVADYSDTGFGLDAIYSFTRTGRCAVMRPTLTMTVPPTCSWV